MKNKKGTRVKGKKKYISVTTCLEIINHEDWNRRRGELGNVFADDMLKTFAEQGTAVHDLVNQLNRKGDFDLDLNPEFIDPIVYNIFLNIAKWFNENVEKVIVTEKRYYSDKYLYHGKPDAVYKLSGYVAPALIDIKTDNDIKPEDFWQLSAYKELLLESGIVTGDRIILHARRDGKFKVIKLDPVTHAKDFQYFLAAKSLYLACNKI